jgi:ParB family transcriptional regulator, chromosome partitioning protein
MAQKIEQLKTTDLIPYAGNTRTHDEKQVAQVAASIKEFGFTNPILVDGENGIIAGHGRLLAAQKLGMESVPCIKLDHLSDAQRRAYVIADNKLALNAGWDEDALAVEIDRLLEDGFDIDLTGFGEDEMGAFEIDEADAPELKEGENEPFRKVTFTIHEEQHEEIQAAIEKAKQVGGGESAINDNSNGNALSWICSKYNQNG